MKKWICFALALVLVLTLLAGCSAIGGWSKADSGSAKEPQAPVPSMEEAEPKEVVLVEEKSETEEAAPAEEEAAAQSKPVREAVFTTEEAFSSVVGEFVDLSQYDYNPPDDGTSYQFHSWYRQAEYRTDYPLDYQIKLSDGTEFTLPVPMAELAEMGWNLQYNDDELEPGYLTFSNFIENEDGKTFRANIYNHNEDVANLSNCMAICADLSPYVNKIGADEEYNIGFTVCGSLTEDASAEDILRVLGAPLSFSISIRHDSDGNYSSSEIHLRYEQDSSAGSYIEFRLDETGMITMVTYSADPW